MKESRDLTPDPDFHLTAEQRHAVYPCYDADALELLLAHLPPEVRPALLAAASDGPISELAAHFPEFANDYEAMMEGRVLPPQLDDFGFEHPDLQRLLDAACRRDL